MGKDDLWDITDREQTQLKLDILRKYLKPWARIIGDHFPDAYYIDCFAGRGKYHKDGLRDQVLGSPLIAQSVALEVQEEKEKKGKKFKLKVIAVEHNKENIADLGRFLKDNDPYSKVSLALLPK